MVVCFINLYFNFSANRMTLSSYSLAEQYLWHKPASFVTASSRRCSSRAYTCHNAAISIVWPGEDPYWNSIDRELPYYHFPDLPGPGASHRKLRSSPSDDPIVWGTLCSTWDDLPHPERNEEAIPMTPGGHHSSHDKDTTSVLVGDLPQTLFWNAWRVEMYSCCTTAT